MASLPEALALNCALASVGKALKQTALTNAGLLHATLLGVVLLSSSFGWRAYSTCVAYLVLGTAVTKVRQKEKEAEGIAEKRGGARGPENVWGSAATAALCAVGAGFFGFPTTLAVAFVASLATKLSDTTQSEIGKAFGKRTYLITTFRSVPRGTEGAVSLEGTLAGLAASVLLPLYAASVGFLGWFPDVPICIVAAFVATTAESLLGATVQGSVAFLTNEVVNFIMTLIGAAVAAGLYVLLSFLSPL